MPLIEEAVDRSLELLHRARHPAGFVASPGDDHYAAIWSRDACVSCLGASRSGDPDLVAGVEATLRTLAALATPQGQVPAVYRPESGYWDWGEAGTTDATAWFVVALAEHVAATGREAVAADLWEAVAQAIRWLGRRDVTGTGLVDSPAGGDWMDSSLNRSGRVFHVNVLAYWAQRGAASLAVRLDRPPPADPVPFGDTVRSFFWPEAGRDLAEFQAAAYPEGAVVRFPHPLAAAEYARLASLPRRHFLSSVSYGRFVDRCDVLAHCLAVGCGLVSGAQAAAVLDYLDDTGCHLPYPAKTWPEPFAPGEEGGMLDAAADRLQAPRWRNPPGAYHNGAVWPYIGAAHAVAALAAGRRARARELLGGVAAANALADWSFPEWIHVPSGRPGAAFQQTWNAGALLWAHSLAAG